jgi:TRAP-type uncharacterized transport system fused permease subunit
MLKTHPFRSALAALCAAAALVAVAGVTDEGKGSGWTDGTQSIANISWILMLLLVASAVALLGIGVAQVVRRRRG